MHSAGVRFMAGSDGPDPYVFPGFSLHDELEWLVKSGFTPLQALQSATFNPALFMSKMDKYGVVELERMADLVLLDANPLDDIRNTRKIFGVVVGWQILFAARSGHDTPAGREAGRPGIVAHENQALKRESFGASARVNSCLPTSLAGSY